MPHMTVLDNAAFGMELAGVPTQERQEKALEALRQVGLKTTLMPTRRTLRRHAPARWSRPRAGD